MQQKTFLSEASFEVLLGSRHYLPLDGGLLFYGEESQKYEIATFDPKLEYTAEHFFQLPEEVPYQLINGKFVQTKGKPLKHQSVVVSLGSIIWSHVSENRLGHVFHYPTDIQLGDKDIYHPDLLFISTARQGQMKEMIIEGAPEFVVEVLSEETEEIDRGIKMIQYGQYDVVEYWIVHPTDEFIEVYYNQNKEMKLVQEAKVGDQIKSKVITDFILDVVRIFS